MESSYVDATEVSTLVSNLKTIWNFTPSESDNVIGILAIATTSNFSASLLELNVSQQKEIEVKRLVFITAGDAYEELDSLKNYNKLDKIDGLAIIPIESIKDLISIL